MNRKLYFSFTTLMGALHRGALSAADLDNAIFFMSRSRENVVSRSAGDKWMTTTGRGGNEAALARRTHGELLAALARAEREGRACYGLGQKYAHLDSLLRGLGLPGLFKTETRRGGAKEGDVIGPNQRIEYASLRRMLAANCPEVELAET